MWSAIPFMLLATLRVHALYVTGGSSCANTCNSQNGTWWTDLVCADSDFSSTSKGQLLQQCMQCQSQSLAINGTNSDQYWFMFHMKYLQQYCLISETTPHIAPVLACATECAPLANVLNVLWINSHPFVPQYAYCTNDSSAYPAYAPDCAQCLRTQRGAVILGNMVDTMANACNEQPLASNGALVQTDRDLFNTTTMVSATTSGSSSSSTSAVQTSSTSATADANSQHQGLSAGAAAGVGVGVAAGVVAAAVAAILFIKKRKHRQQPSGSLLHSENPQQDVTKPVFYPESAAGTATFRSELHSQGMMEADGQPVEKAPQYAELPVRPYR